MIGIPGETADQMKATVDLIKKTKPHGFQINIVTPYPGTPIYRDCLKKGIITEDIEWNSMSCVPTGLPSTVSLTDMTGTELMAIRRKFYRQLYTSPNYILPNVWWALTHPRDFRIAVGYAMNFFSRISHQVAYTH